MFNILVATSIGEEGLDIGEVDLIICYDSTSSPIKNIQRMGRTGRKRDGKVLMLFSSNEESKFDKAMGGYEYIQQHIMKGDFIQLRPQHRMIPDEYKPEAVKQLIQIPEENIELKAEDDEDEIIRIATLYMLGGKGKKGKKPIIIAPRNQLRPFSCLIMLKLGLKVLPLWFVKLEITSLWPKETKKNVS